MIQLLYTSLWFMSLQTFNPAERGKVTYTYESLDQAVRELTKQLARTKAVADELESEIDYRKFTRLSRTQADNSVKFERFQKAFSDLRKNEPGNKKEDEIAAALDAARRQIDQLEKQIRPIKVTQEQAEQERKAAEEEQKKQQAIQAQKSQAQMEAEQQAADLEMLERETTSIVSDMQEVNKMSHQLDNMISDQHETLVKIDKDIAEAKDEMIAGNADLEEAEEFQKGGGGCGCGNPLMPCNVC